MKVQDERPSFQTISSLLSDQQNRNKVIKALLKSLSEMGYSNTVESLRKESNICIQEECITTLRRQLALSDYSAIIDKMDTFKIPPNQKAEMIEVLVQLRMMVLMRKGCLEYAIDEILKSSLNEEKKLKLYEMIALGNTEFSEEDIKKKHEFIIDRCLKNTAETDNFDHLLLAFISEQSSKKQKIRVNNPPRTIVAQSSLLTNLCGKVNFIKLSRDGANIAVVSESVKEFQLAIYEVKGLQKQIVKKSSTNRDSIGCITSVKWSEQSGNRQKILVCSYDFVRVFNTNRMPLFNEVSRKKLNLGKILCAQWHPISQLLYIGGLFNSLMGFDDEAKQLVAEVTPFIKTREIVFTNTGQLFAISAVRGQIIKYCLVRETIEQEFNCDHCFMDLKTSQDRLLAVNSQYIYLFDTSLAILAVLDSPVNEKLYRIEAFMFAEWILIFNEKLTGVMQNELRTRHESWPDCDAIDMNKNRLVTFRNNLKVWESKQQSYQIDQTCISQPCYSSVSESSSSVQSQQNHNEMDIEILDSESYEDQVE